MWIFGGDGSGNVVQEITLGLIPPGRPPWQTMTTACGYRLMRRTISSVASSRCRQSDPPVMRDMAFTSPIRAAGGTGGSNTVQAALSAPTRPAPSPCLTTAVASLSKAKTTISVGGTKASAGKSYFRQWWRRRCSSPPRRRATRCKAISSAPIVTGTDRLEQFRQRG